MTFERNVKLFLFENEDWISIGIGHFTMKSPTSKSLEITIKSETKEMLHITLQENDSFERQNDKVVHIQGKLFSNEYALSFNTKELCTSFCYELNKIKAKQIVSMEESPMDESQQSQQNAENSQQNGENNSQNINENGNTK